MTGTPTFTRLAILYFLGATPLFALLDYAAGVNLRVAFLDAEPRLRAGYYAIVVACGLVTVARPGLGPLVGLLESAANIALLCVGFMLAYLGVLDAAGSDGPITSPFTPEALANFTLSAGWAIASYTAASRRLTRGH